MPNLPARPCRHPGCSALVRDGSGRCSKHQELKKQDDKRRQQQYDQARGSSAQRGYGSRWQKARDGFLQNHPLCAECERAGKVTAAVVVDHVIPHKGDKNLFWDSENWQPLCKACHDRKTAKEDGRWGNGRGGKNL